MCSIIFCLLIVSLTSSCSALTIEYMRKKVLMQDDYDSVVCPAILTMVKRGILNFDCITVQDIPLIIDVMHSF